MSFDACTLENPHPDIENQVGRQPLSYFLTPPEGGLNDQTGLILAIEGYGSRPNSDYAIKLRHYLAGKYNCLCVTVGYFGQSVKYHRSLAPHPDFFVNLKRHHGVSLAVPKSADITDVLYRLAEALVAMGITTLDPSCRVIRQCGEYQSFGLLPAIDHLQVMHEILCRYSILKSRIYVLGSSYGGYIALLLGKFAPNTFRMIIDNSGFSCADNGVFGDSSFSAQIGPLKLIGHEPMVWSREPHDPHCFSRHHALIRDLRVEEHMRSSATRYYCIHYVGDTVAPFADKQAFVKQMHRFAAIELETVTETDIDGSLYKEPIHGMRASLRQLFDRNHARYSAAIGNGPVCDVTDFDLGSRHVFRCTDCSYVFSFSEQTGVTVAVDRVVGFP